LEMASAYETKMRPGPLLATSEMSVFNSWAKFPRIANTVIPANKLVNVSIKLTMIASLNA